VDISERAISIAKFNKNGQSIDYRIAGLANLTYPSNSMDFVFALHSMEYGTKEDISKVVKTLDSILKPGRPILLCVDSTRHPFNGIHPDNINEVSHIAYSIINGIPNHFFTESELLHLFKNYEIEKLEHNAMGETTDKLSPIREWILFGYKR
jgi:SAM-dependent methyltransferase